MRALIKLKNTLNEKGFTLAEGMVTAGLLGIVSLAMLQGFKQDSTTKQLMRLEDEIQSAMKTVNSTLKDTAACTTTFTSVDIPVSGTGAEIITLRDASGAISKYRQSLTGSMIDLQKNAVIAGGSTAAEANLVISEMRLQNFKEFFRFEENMGNSGTSEVTYGVAEFVITFKRKTGVGAKDDGGREASISRSINLTFKTIEGSPTYRVVSCANQSDITALQLKQRVCSQMVQYTGSAVMVGSYNPETGACGGIISSLNEVSTDLLCREMGGHLVPSGTPGKYNCAVIPSGLSNCMNGFKEFGNDGRPICLP